MAELKPWVVCKFGGTSVSSRKTWHVIVQHTQRLCDQGYKVCIVVSAVSQVTNHLEKVVNGLARDPAATSNNALAASAIRSIAPSAALATEANATVATPVDAAAEAMAWIVDRHKQHCAELAVDFSVVTPFLHELERLVEGIRLTGDAASSRLRARVLSFGELMSSHIGEQVLARELSDRKVGLADARRVLVSGAGKDADGIGAINPTDKFLNADVTPFSLDLARAAQQLAAETDGAASLSSAGMVDHRASVFLDHDIVITQGFIASTPEGQPCVLGRGGSDTSGALFAALLCAQRLEIWTDVDGMFSSDPRQVPAARLIEELSYREAQELAAMGAKVLHPRCLGPASWANVPVEIHNTMTQSDKLTRIMAPECLTNGGESKVMAIARRTGQVLLTISTVDMWGESGFLSRVFAPFGRLDISVDLIATSQYAVSMTLDYIPGGISGEPFKLLLRALRRQGTVQVETDCTVVSIVGRKLRSLLHGMADAFRELEKFNLLLLSESTEDLNMSFVLGESQYSVDELVLNLHNVLLEDQASDSSRRPDRGAAQASSLMPSTPPGAAPSMFSGTTPGSPLQRKIRAASFSSSTLLPAQAVFSASLSREGLLDPVTWLADEMTKYERVATPYAIIDLASVKATAPKLDVYCMSWSAQPAVVRTVYETKPTVVFVCRTLPQILELCSIVGPSPRVYVPAAALPSNVNATLPASVKLEATSPSDEAVAHACQLLGAARVIVTSVVDQVLEDAALVVDAWFQTRPSHRISLLTPVPSSVRKIRSLGLFEDVLDTLVTVEPPAGSSDGARVDANGAEPVAPGTRVVMLGVASTAFATSHQAPIAEYVRFSV